MSRLLSFIQMIFTEIGRGISRLIGGFDGLIYALLIFVALNYVAGLMYAVMDRKISREIIFKGIFLKVLIFFLVVASNILDVEVIKNGSVLRTVVIFFYIGSEGISLLKNARRLGLPIPVKMLDILEQLHNKSGERNEADGVGTD